MEHPPLIGVVIPATTDVHRPLGFGVRANTRLHRVAVVIYHTADNRGAQRHLDPEIREPLASLERHTGQWSSFLRPHIEEASLLSVGIVGSGRQAGDGEVARAVGDGAIWLSFAGVDGAAERTCTPAMGCPVAWLSTTPSSAAGCAPRHAQPATSSAAHCINFEYTAAVEGRGTIVADIRPSDPPGSA